MFNRHRPYSLSTNERTPSPSLVCPQPRPTDPSHTKTQPRTLTSCRSVALSLSGNSLVPSEDSRPYVLGISSGTTKAGKEITRD